MKGRAIQGAYLFRLYVCDKEMSWPLHIGETHQPEWVVYVRDFVPWLKTSVWITLKTFWKKEKFSQLWTDFLLLL